MINRYALIRNMWILLGWLALLPVVIIACRVSGGINLPATGSQATPIYVPPTPVPTQPAAGSPVEMQIVPAAQETEQPEAPAEPACIDNLVYLEDLSIPDGTEVGPGESRDKRWKVKNNGTCNWDVNYRIKLVGGPDMGAPQEQTLFPARSGAEAMVRMVFTAPQDAGTYRSAWQAYTPDGTAFGDPFFIEVVVKNP